MANKDTREWIQAADHMGELITIDGADWNLEMGVATVLNIRKQRHALLFDSIKGYPKGYRVLACTGAKASLLALTFYLEGRYSDGELSEAVRDKLEKSEAKLAKFAPRVVKTGPVLENVLSGEDVDLLKFPVPKWHELDGGRYIGTGDAVITKDPDEGWVNLGTYRVMVHDSKTLGFFMSPGAHGRLHYEKHHKRGQRCPIAISMGHHPLVLRIAGLEVLPGTEYQYVGALSGEPMNVIKEEVTGLPIPADSEIVIVGWCPPGVTRKEGPFGEWTGYYASKERGEPIVEVERIYYRNNPIILGAPPGRWPDAEGLYTFSITRGAILQNDLIRAGIPGVKRACWSLQAGRQIIVVSIKQLYEGHAKQVALLTSQSRIGSLLGRYVIVVDDDIDPGNMDDVLWALGSRSDPETDIDITRRARSSPLDPTIRKPADFFFNSRAIIDACKPYEWINEFPQAIRINPDVTKRVEEKWGSQLKLDS